jgi:glycopeptide antibiotics resistance protein
MMGTIASDNNPLRNMVMVVDVIVSGVVAYLYYSSHISIDLAINIMGVTFNFVGACWIASGVYLLSEDFKHLNIGNKSRNKIVNKLSGLLTSASRVIPIGVFHIFLGSAFQILAMF